MSSALQLFSIGYYTFRNNDVIVKAEYSNIKFVLGLYSALFAFMDTSPMIIVLTVCSQIKNLCSVFIV